MKKRWLWNLLPTMVLTILLVSVFGAQRVYANFSWNPCDKQDNREMTYEGHGSGMSDAEIQQSEIQPKIEASKITLNYEEALANPTVTVKITLSGNVANQWSDAGIHIFYDTRLTAGRKSSGLPALGTGEAAAGSMTMSVFRGNGTDGEGCIFAASSYGANNGYKGVMYTISFTLPPTIHPGDVFPIGFHYVEGGSDGKSIFTNAANNNTGMLMQAWLFRFGFTNGYIKIAGGKVSFDANGGTGTMNPVTVKESTYKLPSCSFSRNGYSFVNWKLPDGTTKNAGETISLDGNITLTAQWKAYPVVSFDANGGTGTMNPVIVTGNTYSLPLCSFTREGYRFVNWELPNGTLKDAGETISLTGDITLTAQWEKVAKYLKSVSITLAEPVSGEKPSKSGKITSDPANSLKESLWNEILDWASAYMVSDTDGDIGSYQIMNKEDTFQVGKYYASDGGSSLAMGIALYMALNPEAAFDTSIVNTLADDFYIQVNGTKYSVMAGEKAFYRFGKLAEISIADASVTGVSDQTYTGQAIEPAPTVILGGKTLTKDTDYTVVYSDNTAVGTATITITGKGNYGGTVSKTFSIQGISLASAAVTASDQVYTGSPLTPEPAVKLGAAVLVKGTDYTVAYSNNTNAGMASATVTGKGIYAGTAAGTFRITAKSLEGAGVTVDAVTYTGSGLTPALVVKLDGVTLTAGTDYTATYSDNINVGTATVTVTGKGNYTGTAAGTFIIQEPEEVPADPGQNPSVPAENPADPGQNPSVPAENPADPSAPADTTAAEISPENPAKLADVQKAITTAKNDNDQKGSTFSLLQAKGTAKSASAIKISWTKVPGTKKYIIYGNKCGKGQKYEKLATVKKSKTSWTQKKLKKGTYYKYMVVAVNGSKVLATSKTIHVATNGGTGKKGNAAAITLNKKSISVTAGKTTKKVKATVKAGKLKAAVHRKVKWESDNIGVAKVNSKGYITGVSKGTCYVYAYAQNGLCAKVKVKVK